MKNLISKIAEWTLVIGFFALISLPILFIVWIFFVGFPKYHIWQQGLQGQAELKRATWNRQILVQEAEAKKDSAKLLAEAEVIKAQGIAKANQIIGQSLNKNEAYLRYLWIENLQSKGNQVIYVPTEANLPILEATRKVKK